MREDALKKPPSVPTLLVDAFLLATPPPPPPPPPPAAGSLPTQMSLSQALATAAITPESLLTTSEIPSLLDETTNTASSSGEKENPPQPEWFVCSQCSKTYSSKKQFVKHQTTHEERKFKCLEPGCNAAFRERAKLKRHGLVHTGEKSFPCPKCDKKFAYRHNLSTHMRIHDGDRPYACTYEGCARKFAQVSNLTAHLKVHERYMSGETKPRASTKKSSEKNASGVLETVPLVGGGWTTQLV